MATKTSKSKNRKPLETTLGKASCQDEKEVDLAHVRKPIETSILGLRQIISLYQSATEEVKNYITYECDVMYECRICRTIFRSLANFILHKRKYCVERFSPIWNMDKNLQESNELIEEVVDTESENSRPISPEDSEETSEKTIENVMKKLKERQQITELAQEVLSKDMSTECNKNEEDDRNDADAVLLEPIISSPSNVAVFQTAFKVDKEDPEFMKSEVMEIHGILESDEAVLGPDGKICNFETNKKNEKFNIPKNFLYCPECKMKFSTKKTLCYHIKYKHNNTRLVFVCPDCKDTFANAWCVYRHLYKIHRKSLLQIRKLRDQVHNSCIRKDQEPKKKEKKQLIENISEEDQWMNNFEDDNDLQMCGGCGKRFERKAALHSHSQMCIKRITVMENNAKKKETEEKDVKKVPDKIEKIPLIPEKKKGSAKRKPCLIRTYKPVEEDISACIETKTQSDSSSVNNIVVPKSLQCDVNANNKAARLSSVSSSDDDNESQNSLSLSHKQTLDSLDTESMLKIIGIAADYNRVQFNKIVSNNSTADVNEENVCQADEKFEKYVPLILRRSSPTKTFKDCKIQPLVEDEQHTKEDEVNSGDPDLQLASTSQEIIEEDKMPEENSLDAETIIPKSDLSDQIPSISPPVNSKKSLRLAKLKRTMSVDCLRPHKARKLAKQNKSFSGVDDMNLMYKAAPYMDKNKLMCVPCRVTYGSFAQLMWHMSAHFSWFRFQCSKCSFIAFNKYDCSLHAKMVHNVSKKFIPGVVLPIPNWKTVLMSHDFKPLENDLSEPHIGGDESSGSNEVDAIKDEENKCNSNEKTCNSNDNQKEAIGIYLMQDTNGTETIDLPSPSENDGETISLVSNNAETEYSLSQDCLFINTCDEGNGPVVSGEISENSLEKEKPIPNDDKAFDITFVEEVAGGQKQEFDKVEEVPSVGLANERPVRNRTKSYKIAHNDFLYDLTKVLKLNESKSSKPTPVHKNRKSLLTSIKKVANSSLPKTKEAGAISKSMKVYSRPKKSGK